MMKAIRARPALMLILPVAVPADHGEMRIPKSKCPHEVLGIKQGNQADVVVRQDEEKTGSADTACTCGRFSSPRSGRSIASRRPTIITSMMLPSLVPEDIPLVPQGFGDRFSMALATVISTKYAMMAARISVNMYIVMIGKTVHINEHLVHNVAKWLRFVSISGKQQHETNYSVCIPREGFVSSSG